MGPFEHLLPAPRGVLRHKRHGQNELSQTHPKRKKPIIGLAGGIGAGKSTVARILEGLGATVIDSDRLGHEELGAPDVVATLRQWWGASVCSPAGGVDREKVGAIVFADATQRIRLESLLYPRIRRRREEILEACDADPSVKAVVLDTPKLFEAGLNELCDTVIFVDADWSVRVRRVAEARNWTEEELRRRENLQDPLDMKRAGADHTVINHAGIDLLQSQVEQVLSSMPGFFT